MQQNKVTAWVRIGFFNLFIVACYGMLMRYKIAFEFPYFDQKNLQHAHSHFAFSGWLSLVLMALMVQTLSRSITKKRMRLFNTVLAISLFCAYGMLASFTAKGYWPLSILFATASVFVSFVFGWLFYRGTKHQEGLPCRKWFLAAILFNVMSALGTFYLSYMMATKNINQHSYLASVYWYLHFQYNGYFLFGCIGLLVNYLQSRNIQLRGEKLIFLAFAWSCLPAYGLSVLWLKLPAWVFVVVVLASAVQLFGWIKLLWGILQKRILASTGINKFIRWSLAAAAVAMSIKILLQTASTIPALSKLAFGFRPIVIAYLHLVLLGIFTLFITGYAFARGILRGSGTANWGIGLLLAGVLLNELLLAIQGLFSLSYTVVPWINESLLGAAIVLWTSIALICLSQFKQKLTIEKTAIL